MRKSNMLAAVLGAAVIGLGTSGVAQAADGATVYKTKTCIACHGVGGAKPIMPAYPKLAGQNAKYIEDQIKDIISGARANGQAAAMKGALVDPDGNARISDEEIKAVAEWLSSQK